MQTPASWGLLLLCTWLMVSAAEDSFKSCQNETCSSWCLDLSLDPLLSAVTGMTGEASRDGGTRARLVVQR